MTRNLSHIARTGRPRLYKTQQELDKLIAGYFNDCDSRIKTTMNKDGDELTMLVPAPYTLSGLALYLGMDRHQLMEYEQHDEFHHSIRLARLKIAADMERRLYETPNQAGIIFGLKNNYGWRDTQEIRQTNVEETTHIYRPEKLPEPVEGEITGKGLPEPKE